MSKNDTLGGKKVTCSLRSASLAGSFAGGKVATYEREPHASILDKIRTIVERSLGRGGNGIEDGDEDGEKWWLV